MNPSFVVALSIMMTAACVVANKGASVNLAGSVELAKDQMRTKKLYWESWHSDKDFEQTAREQEHMNKEYRKQRNDAENRLMEVCYERGVRDGQGYTFEYYVTNRSLAGVQVYADGLLWHELTNTHPELIIKYEP